MENSNQAECGDLSDSAQRSDDSPEFVPSNSSESEDEEVNRVLKRLSVAEEAAVARKRSLTRSSKSGGDNKRKKVSGGKSTSASRVSCREQDPHCHWYFLVFALLYCKYFHSNMMPTSHL